MKSKIKKVLLMIWYMRTIQMLIPDKVALKIIYRINLKKKLNLNQPKTFNEKLQWLKLYDRVPMYEQLVDKFEVRKYISKTIGKEYLIPILGVWDQFDDIDFDKLPDQFVLKCTHDSGGVVICKDKSTFNISAARVKINKCLKTNFYYSGREWPYKNIKPRIIAEKYMVNKDNTELNDYKIMCFNGKPECSFVCSNRFRGHLNVDFFDLEWNHMPFERKYSNSKEKISKPIKYDEMLELASNLAQGLTFIRVDFYEIQGKIYFGELTFFPGSGLEEFRPDYYDELLGSWMQLPN